MDRRAQHIRVVTYNIHKGFSPIKRAFVLEGMRRAIHDLGCDLAFLQEVVGCHRRHERKVRGWSQQPQAEYLAGDGGWPFVVYHKNRVHRHGHHGNAILSRAPVLHSDYLNISTNRFERRGLIHSVLAWPDPGRRLHAICVHLDLLEGGRRKQVARIIDLIREHVPEHEPLIVAGDFNDWRKSISPVLRAEAGLTEVFEHATGDHARTFPGALPILPLDRIYVRGLQVHRAETHHHGKHWGRLSDHAPLAATLGLR